MALRVMRTRDLSRLRLPDDQITPYEQWAIRERLTAIIPTGVNVLARISQRKGCIGPVDE